HGNALFFIARVTDYKRALGAPTPHDLLETLWAYPHLLIREEPAAGMLLALGLTAWALTRRPPTTDDAEPRLVSPSPARPNGRGHHRAATLLASALTLPGLLLVTLIVGSLGDGAPTH